MVLELFFSYLQSPIGVLKISATSNAVVGLERCVDVLQETSRANHHTKAACEQLEEYFEGERCDFSLPLAPHGTDFQQKVWHGLLQIPFGKTVSYAQLANNLEKPKACRAVGNANGKNPMPILIPCHRVVASNGGIGGYSAGLDAKHWLLAHEATAA